MIDNDPDIADNCGAYTTCAGVLNSGVACERPIGHDGLHCVSSVAEAGGNSVEWEPLTHPTPYLDTTPWDDMAPAELRDDPAAGMTKIEGYLVGDRGPVHTLGKARELLAQAREMKPGIDWAIIPIGKALEGE